MTDDDEQGAPYLGGREKQEKRKRERIPKNNEIWKLLPCERLTRLKFVDLLKWHGM